MKHYFSPLFCALVTVGTSFLSVGQEPKVFEKLLFLELDAQRDSVLFMNYSNAWSDSWRYMDKDLSCQGSELMNEAAYKKSFDKRKENLYTLIHPKVLDGSLTLYSPYDPIMFGLNGFDQGALLYPVKGTNSADNFFTSDELRCNMVYYLGDFGPQSDIPLVNEFGDPIIVMEDGMEMFVYPPRPYFWTKDSNITKYRIRIKVLVKKNGEEKMRIIQSIAPVTNVYDGDLIVGERELFWLDFNEAKPFLAKGYYFNEQGKPVTFLKYIEEKVKVAK